MSANQHVNSNRLTCGNKAPDEFYGRTGEIDHQKRITVGEVLELADEWHPANPRRIRTYTDNSGSFKVDAELIGLLDGNVHSHKVNGVNIAVPTAKMSLTGLAYAEGARNENDDLVLSAEDRIRQMESSSFGAALDNEECKCGTHVHDSDCGGRYCDRLDA